MFDLMNVQEVPELHFCNDKNSGLQAVIAIHSTARGPALGGCRCVSYSDSNSAVIDACQLARGMTYKASLADIPHGGGKAVILKPDNFRSRRALFSAFGRFIDNLQGRYITAVDSGTSPEDMDIVASQTAYVSSTTAMGNPSPFTAQGVLAGIRAAVLHQLQQHDLSGVHVAICGLGQVGTELAEQLLAAGAKLTVADIDPDKVKALQQHENVSVSGYESIHSTPCDVFSPCALGGAINHSNVNQLNCKIIAGSANNQLASSDLGSLLHSRHILYAPDYALNAGGLIYAAMQHRHANHTDIAAKVEAIATTLGDIFQQSTYSDTPTSVIADRLAEAKLYLKPSHKLRSAQLTNTVQAKHGGGYDRQTAQHTDVH